MASRRVERGTAWVSVEDAARLAAVSPATVRSWIRRGVLRARGTGVNSAPRLEDVVARAARSGRELDAPTLQTQADAALAKLAEMAELVAQFEQRTTELEDQYARREKWARGQHERELREVYARWEQERARWEETRGEARAEPAVTEVLAPPATSNGDLTTKPPIPDDLLPPLHAASAPGRNGDIMPGDHTRTRWRPRRP